MTKIKICGLKSLEDIAAVNALQPDYAGFVFAKSKRQVTRSTASTLKKELAPSIKAVGVFVQEEATQIAKIAAAGIIDVIQLHGDESPEFIKLLKCLTPVPIIKVVRVQDEKSLLGLEEYPCDYFLFDTFSKESYGGVGKQFEVSKILTAQIPQPYFIAGGLKADNVQEVITRAHPYGVDVSGGVETMGKKDYAKIKEFIATVRGANKDD